MMAAVNPSISQILYRAEREASERTDFFKSVSWSMVRGTDNGFYAL